MSFLRRITRQLHNHLFLDFIVFMLIHIPSRGIQHFLQLSPASGIIGIGSRASASSVLSDIEHRLVCACRLIRRDAIRTIELVCTDIHCTVLDTVGEVNIRRRQSSSVRSIISRIYTIIS